MTYWPDVRGSRPTLTRPLTPRQTQVARLVGAGFTYAQVGALLEPRVAVRTVKREVEVINQRLRWPESEGLTSRQRVHAYARIVFLYREADTG